MVLMNPTPTLPLALGEVAGLDWEIQTKATNGYWDATIGPLTVKAKSK